MPLEVIILSPFLRASSMALNFFTLALLRKDEHHVKDSHDDDHHRQRIAENGRNTAWRLE